MNTILILAGITLAAAALVTTGILIAANNPKIAAKFKSAATKARDAAEAKARELAAIAKAKLSGTSSTTSAAATTATNTTESTTTGSSTTSAS